ncbi:hypothetical protein CJI58_005945 [Bifidobacteriaceae bacterium NR047]|nr:hypothetical protein [Bifidobacteriaceae bacterium NR047]MDZ7550111.1 hypothetical protein [Bifidobacteriaceae bacterium NR047]
MIYDIPPSEFDNVAVATIVSELNVRWPLAKKIKKYGIKQDLYNYFVQTRNERKFIFVTEDEVTRYMRKHCTFREHTIIEPNLMFAILNAGLTSDDLLRLEQGGKIYTVINGN